MIIMIKMKQVVVIKKNYETSNGNKDKVKV